MNDDILDIFADKNRNNLIKSNYYHSVLFVILNSCLYKHGLTALCEKESAGGKTPL